MVCPTASPPSWTSGMAEWDRLQQSHPQLHGLCKRHWQTPLADYAPLLFETGRASLEEEFLNSFKSCLLAQGYSEDQAHGAKAQLLTRPVLQTSHHVTPTHGPTFFTLDLICLTGLDPAGTLLIGANSGVAFSNSAWSGALSYRELELVKLLEEGKNYREIQKSQQERHSHGAEEEQRISLIPSRLRDQLVYGEAIPERLLELWSEFKDPFKSLIKSPDQGSGYSGFAAQMAGAIERRIFQRDLLIFDINEVVAGYLVKILGQADHPITSFLFDVDRVKAFNQASGQNLSFLTSAAGKKSAKVEPLIWDGTSLEGPKWGRQEFTPEELAAAIENNRLCPGVAILFLVLLFQGIKCLGSFNQAEYLADLRTHFQAAGFDGADFYSPLGEEITMGRLLKGGKPFMPLDLLVRGETIDIKDYAHLQMGELWQYYLNRI